MKFNLRPAFVFVALGPFVACGFLAACANAENPQTYPQGLKKVEFSLVEDTQKDLGRYPFIKDAFSDIKQAGLTQEKVYVAKIDNDKMKDVYFEFVEGACGIYCQFYGYTKTTKAEGDFAQIFQLLANRPVYLQDCPGEIAVISTGGNESSDNVTKWVYGNGTLKYKAVYPNLNSVPACAKK